MNPLLKLLPLWSSRGGASRAWLAGIGFLCLYGSVWADEVRDFRNVRGQVLRGSLESVEGEWVSLKRESDGKVLRLQLSNLSVADRQWIQKSAFVKPDGISGAANRRFYPRTMEQIEAQLAVFAKKDAAGPEGALNVLNTYRYLSGVPHTVRLDPGHSAKAKEAATACRDQRTLSHDLGHYTDVCCITTGGDVKKSIPGYMEDPGAHNRAERGHRFWCLQPRLETTGFGSAGPRYSAMYVGDYTNKKPREAWGYPAQGYYPHRYLHGDAWSWYLTKPAPKAALLTVEVVRLSVRPQKPLPDRGPLPGEAVAVGFVGVYENAINFEPDVPFDEPGLYWVRITGGGVKEGYLVELYGEK